MNLSKRSKKVAFCALCTTVYIVTFFSLVYFYKCANEFFEVTQKQHQQIEKLQQLFEESDIRNDVLKLEIEKLKSENERLSTFRAKVTAYAPLDNKSGICADGNPKVTATGTQSMRGIVAVDPSKIPYFTLLEIPGYGTASAEDTGGAVRGYDGIAIDVLVDSYEEAMKWGVRYLDVKIK